MSEFIVRDTSKDNERECNSRAEAEETKNDLVSLGANPEDIEIIPPEGEEAGHITEDGAVVQQGGRPDEDAKPAEPVEPEQVQEEDALDQLGESIEQDPLDVLPGYMITHVDGKPSLNKRGVSVLAYHFDVDVIDQETVAYPHETDYESAYVEVTVEGAGGRTFVGSGEAHVDQMSKHKLLRMAQTRAYKRAVIFATGTGIVGYQEITSQL